MIDLTCMMHKDGDEALSRLRARLLYFLRNQCVIFNGARILCLRFAGARVSYYLHTKR